MNAPAFDPLNLDFDPDALRERYRLERDRRLRAEGEDQFVEVSGKFARYGGEDPYVTNPISRPASQEEIEVVIIGGGWGGLFSAARLRQAGINDIKIIEAGADFGGTWYWNRYPGAQCDIESYCYVPLLEETNYVPKEKYSFAPEIFEHAQRIGRHFDLYGLTYFQTKVSELRWDEVAGRWIVKTNRGDAFRARFVVAATGPANRPKLPGIPGLETFAGKTFHTSRWDYDYTGGDHSGGLTKLADKTIAIIGTGATAIQCVPHVGEHAKHLYVFQRTPSGVDRRGNRPTDPEWAKSLKPGWQRERQQNFDSVIRGLPVENDLVDDCWTDIFRNLQAALKSMPAPTPADMERLTELADFQKMNEIRRRVDESVADPVAAEALKPWYRQLCKRPTFNDEYLPTFNRPNVTLVDTSASKGVERITNDGVIANGQAYKVDCIIFATGFEIGTAPKRRIGIEIFGRDGVSLYDYWANGLRTLHGHSSHGFPNLFLVGPSQNAVSVNFSAMVGEQARHIAYIIDQTKARQATRVEPTPDAENAWIAEIRRLSTVNRAFFDACTPGYYNQEGRNDVFESGLYGNIYSPGINAFNTLLEQWREAGDLNGLSIR